MENTTQLYAQEEEEILSVHLATLPQTKLENNLALPENEHTHTL